MTPRLSGKCETSGSRVARLLFSGPRKPSAVHAEAVEVRRDHPTAIARAADPSLETHMGEFSQAVRFTYRQIITISTESSTRLI